MENYRDKVADFSGSEDVEDPSSAYVGDLEGNLIDGVVVADLDDEDAEPESSGTSSDEEADNANEIECSGDDSFHCFEGHTDSVYSVAWSPKHPDLVASGGGDDMAFLWRVGEDAFQETQGQTYELAGHSDSVVALKFSCDGELLGTGSMDGTVKVWTSKDGELVQTLEGPGEAINWVDWHPKGEVVLAGSEDYSVWMWNVRTGRCMQVFSGHGGSVNCGQFTPDGKSVVTGAQDGSLRVWNPKTGECSVALQDHGGQGGPFHRDGAAVSGGDEGGVHVSNLATGRVAAELKGHTDSVECISLSRFLPLCATASVDCSVGVWDTGTATQRSRLEHPQAVNKVACGSDNALLVSSCLDGLLRCWDIRTGQCEREWQGHTQGILDLAVSPDFSMLLTGSDDKTCKMFKV
uniref:Ribosome assembly protein SQT1 n=1 Tax=Tetraselmis sp. GSL018 TaxID=582737 RepID=A0A061QHP1_9CHLO